MHTIKILFFAALCFAFNSQALAQKKLLNGNVVSQKDSIPIEGVHVINVNSNQATNTILDGFFTIPYSKGDTILISSIAHNDHYLFTDSFWLANGKSIIIFMTEKIHRLNTFDVNQYNSKEDFRDAFNSQKPHKPINPSFFEYKKPTKLEDVRIEDLNAHIPLSSPITFLYKKFGKEARQAKKLKKAKKENEEAQIIEERYNPAVIQEALNLDSEVESEKFMEKCPLSDVFILKAKKYDIIKSILDCQKRLKIEH